MDVGTRIEQYVIIEHIGSGGWGDVWSARDARLGRTVAIKTIRRNLRDEFDPLARFEQEAQTIASLEHPHILPLYEFGDFEGQRYIVMRYVSGGSLSDRMVEQLLPPYEALRIGRAVASALDYAHSRGVVHRDVKPANVLLDANDVPYLADFGLATPVGKSDLDADQVTGTPEYMAPEQWIGATLDQRTDVYAFGVMLYRMLTGELPFGSTGRTGLLMLMHGETLPDPSQKVPGLSPWVWNVLRRATAVDIHERYESAGAVIRALEPLIEAPPVLALEADQETLALLEAENLFALALRAWGQGNFTMSATDFILVNGYCQPGGALERGLNEYSRGMMLRGAIEYDHEVSLWQGLVAPETLQEVCQHTLTRSILPAARARALRLLRDRSEAVDPGIARTVARALSTEVNVDVRAASVELLAAHGGSPPAWRPAAYAPAIDERLADEALKADAPAVAEAAARAVGRLRSKAGVDFLLRAGAVGALALVRDEAPNLPDSAPPRMRARAFLALTWRKLSRPSMTWRFVAAAAGGMVGMGGFVFVIYPRHELTFLPARLLNTVGTGVPVGLLVGLLALLTVETPERLRGLWMGWARLPFFWLLGSVVATLPLVYYWMGLLNIADPPWPTLAVAAVSMSSALLLGPALRLPAWARVAAAVIGVGAPPLLAHYLYGALQLDMPLYYFENTAQAWELSLLLSGATAIGVYALDLPHGRAGLAGALVSLAAYSVVALAIRAIFGASELGGALVLSVLRLVILALAGLGVAALASAALMPPRVGRIALAAGAAFSAASLVLFPPGEGVPPGNAQAAATALHLASGVVGTLLAGSAAASAQARRTRRP